MLDFGNGGNPFNAVSVSQEDIVEETPDLEENIEDPDDLDDIINDDIDPSIDEADDDLDDIEEGDDSDDQYNPYYELGSEFKKDLFLSEDIEITEDIDGLTLKEKIKDSFKKQLEPQIKAEYDQALAAQGYDEKHLLISRALIQGVDPRLLSEASMYETFANVSDDIDISQKELIISQMYRARGFQESEIKNQIRIAKGDDSEDGIVGEEFDNLFNSSKKFFEGKYSEFVEQEEIRNRELKKQAEQAVRKSNELIRSVISNKQIKDFKISEDHTREFEDSIRKANIVDINGQKYQATELQKFLYDFQIDDELKLLAFYQYKFREQQKQELKKEVKKEVESEFMKSYKSKIIKQKASKNKRRNNQHEGSTEKKGNSFFIDFSK